MKWVTMLLLTMTLASCAHHFRDRHISSVEEQQQEDMVRRSAIDPRGGRY